MGMHEKPFHSRIFRIYLAYLEKRLHWNSEKIAEFLRDLSISRERLDDEGSWFSAEFADRFYEELVKRTGDSQLAYKAGHFIHEASSSPVMHRLIRGVMEPSFVYRLLTRFSGHYTKAAKFSIVSVGKSSAHVESIPEPGFSERPYMCENRRGMLEGVSQVFGLPAATIDETECLHRGGRKCSYHVHWERLSEKNYWIRMASIGGMGLGPTFAFGSKVSGIASILFFSGFLFLWVYRKFQNQREELMQQNGALDEMLRELGRRNQQLQLIGQVAKLTHSLTSPQEISLTIVKAVCEQLGYDRCILLTTDFKKNILRVTAFHGFEEKLKELISQAEFHLDAENTSGFFVRVVNTKEPILIPDVPLQLKQLSARSQKFAKILGSKSFVAVPLFNESREVVGVLSVDHISEGKLLSISDQDLLMTLAQHLGIALHNAQLVKQLEENLFETRKFSVHEKNFREIFQRFLPASVADELMNASRQGQPEQNLFQVRKRSVAILFLDIVGFTSLADGMESEDVVDMLNTAYSVWEPIVKSYRGFVDKFLGDGMLAIFDDADRAVDKATAAAIDMAKAVPTINGLLAKKNYPQIRCGIGVNFGPTILGNIGSHQRLNFTAIGEAVNFAFRLQSHTREIGENAICVSHGIVKRWTNEAFSHRNVGTIAFKGYEEPVSVFEVLTSDPVGSLAKAQNQGF